MRRRYGEPLFKNVLKDLPCPHRFCRWRGRRFFWGPPLWVGGRGQPPRRARPNPPSPNGTLRANPQKDRQQALTTAHIQSRFHRHQNSNRLDRRRRPPGRQRRGLCGHCLNRARCRTLRQNWPSRSLYRSPTYRSHHRSQPWLKHRQGLPCRSRHHLPSFVSTQVCFKWNRLPWRQAPKVTWLRSFRRTAPIKRPPWWR